MASSVPIPLTDPFDRALTHRDLDDTPDDGNRYEIIDGILHVSPFPSTAHQRIATHLTALLYTYVKQNKLGQVFAAGLKVVLDEPTGVGPDITYISTHRLESLQEDGYYGSPDLLVEILSSKPALDTQIKKQKYARAGVPHYWIVDPAKKRLLAYRLDGDCYRLVAEHTADDIFQPDLFPGLTIPLTELWA